MYTSQLSEASLNRLARNIQQYSDTGRRAIRQINILTKGIANERKQGLVVSAQTKTLQRAAYLNILYISLEDLKKSMRQSQCDHHMVPIRSAWSESSRHVCSRCGIQHSVMRNPGG